MADYMLNPEQRDLLDRFEVKLSLVAQGYYGRPMEHGVIGIEVSDELKAELIEALELGANVEDESVSNVVLLLTSTRHAPQGG